MLRAFQKQLEILAKKDSEKFSKHIEQRYRKKPPKGLIEDLTEFILLLPRVQKKIVSLWMRLPASSKKIKNVGSYFMAYMYQPDDFVPENEKNGLFGYLDDAYLAATFYELIFDEIERSEKVRLKKKDKKLLDKVIGLKRKARAVMPDEAIKIKQMFGELFEGDEKAYVALFVKKLGNIRSSNERMKEHA